MRVFISWSGDLSRQIGEAFREWLPSALQYVKPYFSPADIEKGARWSGEISKELSSSAVCIIVLTPDNLNSNWIMFESGAVSKSIESSRVCPVLFDIEPTDLQGPLAQFQITKFSKFDMKKLFITINSASNVDTKLENIVADTVFEKWWPDLEAKISEIITSYVKPAKDVRSDRDLIEEILLLVRSRSLDRPVRAPVPYKDGVYKMILDLLHNLWSHSNLDIDQEKQLLDDLNSVRALAEKRLGGEIKDGFIRDISTTISAITKLLKDNSTILDDDIPF